MLGKKPKGLNVENESLSSPFHPEATGLLVGQGVVEAIDLDEVKLAGIELETGLRRLGPIGVEPPALYQGGVSPGAGADQYLCHLRRFLVDSSILAVGQVLSQKASVEVSETPWLSRGEVAGTRRYKGFRPIRSGLVYTSTAKNESSELS